MTFLLISDELVRASITAQECITAVEEGFRLYATGQLEELTARTLARRADGSVNLYAADVPGFGLGAKVLTAYENNPKVGVPYIYASVLFLAEETGHPLALIDGRYLTALRTAAATAIGARWLCRPDSKVLGILGSGLQARTHLLCHMAIHPFERIVIWARNIEHADAYIREMQSKVMVPIELFPTAEAVVDEADVIACTTRSRTPLFAPGHVRPGTHIGVAGPLRHDGSEIPLSLLQNVRLFVDNREKFDSLWLPGNQPAVQAELGEIIVGELTGREDDTDITIFKPVGMAFEDVVSARIVIDRVRENGTGITVPW